MPFYFDVVRTTASNAAGNTLSTHLRALTIANQKSAGIVALYGTARAGTAGGGSLQLRTCATAGTGGTAQTPNKRNPAAPAAETTVFNDATAITPGGTPLVRVSIGNAQTGGMGGWVALEPDAAVALAPNAGANGNLEVASFFNAASVAFDVTAELRES